jgi:hypothetical protein
VSKSLVGFGSFLNGLGDTRSGGAFFPFIFVKSEQSPFINHERIHFLQQIELLFVGFYLLYIFEIFYARFFLKKTNFEAYMYNSAEKEAYLNQNNLDYLKNRKPWAQFKYFRKNKY